MTLRSSDLQSDSDLDSIRNSCDVSLHSFPQSLSISSSFSHSLSIFSQPGCQAATSCATLSGNKSLFLAPQILEKGRKKREGQYCIQITLSKVEYGQVTENELESPYPVLEEKILGAVKSRTKLILASQALNPHPFNPLH